MKLQFIKTLYFLLFILVQLGALSTTSSWADGEYESHRLTILMEKWPVEMHPGRGSAVETTMINKQVYETLVHNSPSGELKPNLLKSWEYNPNNFTYSLNIKPNIYFSNGVLLTSKIVETRIETLIRNSRFVNFMRIQGAQEFLEKRSPKVEGIKIVDELTLQVQFSQDNGRFLDDLTDPLSVIYYEDGISAQPFGTGFYRFLEINEDEKIIVLEKNYQHRESLARFEKLFFTTQQVQRADIYLTYPSDHPFQNKLKEIQFLDTEVYALHFNTTHPKFKSLKVRKFLLSLLNQNVLDQNLGPINYVVGGYVPLGLPGHQPYPKVDLSISGHEKPTVDELPQSLNIVTYLPKYLPVIKDYCHILESHAIHCSYQLLTSQEIKEAKKKDRIEIVLSRNKPSDYSAEELLLNTFSRESKYSYSLIASLTGEITQKFSHLTEAILNTPRSDSEKILELIRDFDNLVMSEAIAKPLRYGVNKQIWIDDYFSTIELPPLTTLGVLGLDFNNVIKTSNHNMAVN